MNDIKQKMFNPATPTAATLHGESETERTEKKNGTFLTDAKFRF